MTACVDFSRQRLYRPTEGSTSRINDRNYQSQIIHGRFHNASDPGSEKSNKQAPGTAKLILHPARTNCLIKILKFRLLIFNLKKKNFAAISYGNFSSVTMETMQNHNERSSNQILQARISL